MTFPRLFLLAAALIGQAVVAQAQGAFPAPLPGQVAAPAGAPAPMTAGPSSGASFPAPSAGGGFAPPGAMSPGGPQQAGPGGPPSAGQQCQVEFGALKADAQKKAEAISAVSKRKGTAADACKAFSSFTQAETKMISYVETNSARCGIPSNIADTMKKSHATTMGVQSKICAAAQGQANQQPAAPSLSEAIGSASLPESRTTKKGGSTFDTLNGNVLAR